MIPHVLGQNLCTLFFSDQILSGDPPHPTQTKKILKETLLLHECLRKVLDDLHYLTVDEKASRDTRKLMEEASLFKHVT